ncbi:MAG: hypothetical protein IJ125_09785 [Atopobiaceae bacterium]|nr:hypothetical protein [Atopobiaceae bacterium]
MSIDLVKPEPMRVGNRYIYSLTSYEPVSVNLMMPRITDAEVDMAINSLVQPAGLDAQSIDDAWVSENVQNVSSIQELKSQIRKELGQLNAQMLERQKEVLALNELTKRLVQSVPADEVHALLDQVRYSFDRDLKQRGTSIDQLVAQGATSREELDAMFAEQAREAAEQQAALSAFAHERKIEIDDAEIGSALHLNPEQTEKLIAEAQQAGTMDILRTNATLEKAVSIIAEEANVTYVQESERQAEARVRQLEEMMAAQAMQAQAMREAHHGHNHGGCECSDGTGCGCGHHHEHDKDDEDE